ncbi:Hypothetical protein NocV09_00402730 [Nannochloropsis oceanica]
MRYSLRAIVDQVLQERGGRPLDLKFSFSGPTKQTTAKTRTHHRPSRHQGPSLAMAADTSWDYREEDSSLPSSSLITSPLPDAKRMKKSLKKKETKAHKEKDRKVKNKTQTHESKRRMRDEEEEEEEEMVGDEVLVEEESRVTAAALRKQPNLEQRQQEKKSKPQHYEVMWVPMAGDGKSSSGHDKDKQQQRHQRRQQQHGGIIDVSPKAPRSASDLQKEQQFLARREKQRQQQQLQQKMKWRKGPAENEEKKANAEEEGRGEGRLVAAVTVTREKKQKQPTRKESEEDDERVKKGQNIVGKDGGRKRGEIKSDWKRPEAGAGGVVRQHPKEVKVSAAATTTARPKERKKERREERRRRSTTARIASGMSEEKMELEEQLLEYLPSPVYEEEDEKEDDFAQERFQEQQCQQRQQPQQRFDKGKEQVEEKGTKEGCGLQEQMSSLEAQVAAIERMLRRDRGRDQREDEDKDEDEDEDEDGERKAVDGSPMLHLRRRHLAFDDDKEEEEEEEEKEEEDNVINNVKGQPAAYLPALSSASSSDVEEDEEEEEGEVMESPLSMVGGLEARLASLEIDYLKSNPRARRRMEEDAREACEARQARLRSQAVFDAKMRTLGGELEEEEEMEIGEGKSGHGLFGNNSVKETPRPSEHYTAGLVQGEKLKQKIKMKGSVRGGGGGGVDGYDSIQSLLAQLQELQEEFVAPDIFASSTTATGQEGRASEDGGKVKLIASFSSAASGEEFEGGMSGATDLSMREEQLDALEARLAGITALIRSELPR